ncbi:AsnC family transcriptional regulator [Streptomyces sp. AV19]|uniref:Lrp/AsnC family transcriptional regulator n=1 Tax=Streptomyces sp. AV19 TaxID=2793068 RepID=UPI002412F16A|nr:AsnC family transcriptional regulator [Streptomyces sp. AV19]MDG4536284.1 Lrp/AsnC family transcriptional regulator [Streptomyces sp. AV19]
MNLDSKRAVLPVLDSEQDQLLAHALQIDGRAPFRRIAEVLGVSDQTVARRYARLRSAGSLRVVGLTDPLRLGEVPWFVRVRCAPNAAVAIGEALARRADTTWVSLTSGGTEISCLVRPRAGSGGDALLLEKLPKTPRVVDVSAHCLLHVFFGQDLSLLTKSGPLTAEQVAALRPANAPDSLLSDPAPAPAYPLDEADGRLLDLLARDGRAAAGELAAATGWSPTTVRRRMTELREAGVLYFDLDYDLRVLQRNFRAALWLNIEPSEIEAAGAALAAHPEVSFAAATTGDFNVYAGITAHDAGAFYHYLTGPVAALPGILGTSTSPIHRAFKGAGPL